MNSIASFFGTHFGVQVLVVVGFVLALFGAISREKGGKPLEVKGVILNPPLMSQRLRTAVIIIGVLLVLSGAITAGLSEYFPGLFRGSDATGAVSLLNLTYAHEWDPRLVDLTTAASDGIQVQTNDALRFLNLWVSSTGDAPTHKVWAEVYPNDDYRRRIGHTEPAVLAGKAVRLGDVVVDDYQYDRNVIANAWQVQAGWQTVTIRIMEEAPLQPRVLNRTDIKLNPQGGSWLFAPPNLSFAAVAYTVNNGSESLLDLSQGQQMSIRVVPGDTLTVKSIWYRSNAGSKTLQVEGYLTKGGYDGSMWYQSPVNAVQDGIHRVADFSPMTWLIPKDKDWLVLSLARDDEAVTDRLTVHLASDGRQGLVQRADAVVWQAQTAQYLDFEPGARLDDFLPSAVSSVGFTNTHAFSGEQSLAVTMIANPADEVVLRWNQALHAEAIVGQVYWPSRAGISITWAQACAWACVPIHLKPDQWNTFVMDFSELKADGTVDGQADDKADIPYLNQVESPDLKLIFQAGVSGVDGDHPYTFYLDGIQIYPVHS